MQGDEYEATRKIIAGLRELAAADGEIGADRVNGFASDLAKLIDYSEPSVDPAASDYAAQRVAEMMAAPQHAYTAPDRLTVTIEGPQASGKTRAARFIDSKLVGYTGLHPRIIEIDNDGRRLDWSNGAYLND